MITIADIVKMIDSQPDLAPLIRRVRGGYLKIQGTWMPYEVSPGCVARRRHTFESQDRLTTLSSQVALKLSRRSMSLLFLCRTGLERAVYVES